MTGGRCASGPMRPCRRGRRCPKSRTNERQGKASQATNPHTATTKTTTRSCDREHCEDSTGTRAKRPCPLPPRPQRQGHWRSDSVGLPLRARSGSPGARLCAGPRSWYGRRDAIGDWITKSRRPIESGLCRDVNLTFAATFRRESALCECPRFSLCPYVFVPACLSSSSRC